MKLRRCQGGVRVGTDALHHGAESVRALRCQMLAQAQAVEQLDRVGAKDVLGAPARIGRQQNGDQAFHDMRVAVAGEFQRSSS